MRAEERGIVLVTVLLLALTNRNMPEAGDRQLAEFRSRDRLWSTPNLGLLTVAALLPDSFEITYVDQTFEAIPERGFTYVLLSPLPRRRRKPIVLPTIIAAGEAVF